MILGGGAGGLELAAALSGRADMAITLVDRVGSHLWKPRLHEFAAGTVNSTLTEISFYSLAEMRGFHFEQGDVQAIDRAARTVTLAPLLAPNGNTIAGPRSLAYEACVIALGGATPDFGTKGVRENAIRLETKADADRFRELFVALMIRARETGEPTRIVIVGSGATGIELAAHLRLAERAFTGEGGGKATGPLLTITILEAAPQIMPGSDDTLRRTVLQRISNLRIEVATDAAVTVVEEEKVAAKDGREWPSDLTVWAAGLVGAPILKTLDAFDLDRRGRIVVDRYLRVEGDEMLFAMGDAASVKLGNSDQPLPPTAQAASQEAEYLSGALPKMLRGERVHPLQYRNRGTLLSLARGGAAGRIGFGGTGDILVKGQFAKAAYHGLQRRHQWAVLGPLRGSVAILADIISPTKGPALKLHG